MDKHERAAELIKGVKRPSWDRYKKYGDSLPLVEQLAWVKNFRDGLVDLGKAKELGLSQKDMDQIERDYEALITAVEAEHENAKVMKQVNLAIEKKHIADGIPGKSAKPLNRPSDIFKRIADKNRN